MLLVLAKQHTITVDYTDYDLEQIADAWHTQKTSAYAKITSKIKPDHSSHCLLISQAVAVAYDRSVRLTVEPGRSGTSGRERIWRTCHHVTLENGSRDVHTLGRVGGQARED